MKNQPDIQESYIVRDQSPHVEDIMRHGIHDAIKGLLEGSYLYQNRTIDLTAIKAKADAKFSAEALEHEFQHRPWVPFSKNRGFTSNERQLLDSARGCDALGTPPAERRLTFIIPTIETGCHTCGTTEPYDSIPHLEFSPYHLNPEAIREPLGYQTFLFNFQCHKCKSPPLTFMVRRELTKVQLCGRSKPFFPPVPREIPKPMREIYKDAVAAAACGDWAGAFYHLRTLMEHHMKAACRIPLARQIDGTVLCQEYNKVIDPIVAQRAAVTQTFADCCANLHNRTGGRVEYEAALKLIEGHFRLIANLEALNPSQTPNQRKS